VVTVPERYRRTDRRHAISLPRSALASRGKNGEQDVLLAPPVNFVGGAGAAWPPVRTPMLGMSVLCSVCQV